MKSSERTPRERRPSDWLSYEQRLRKYHEDKREWLRNHPYATTEQVNDQIRALTKKYRI